MKHFYYFFEGKHITPPNFVIPYKSTSYTTDTLFQALMQCIGVFTIPFYLHCGNKKGFSMKNK